MSASPRRRAREFLVQALYQQQLAGHSAGELAEQFADAPGFNKADEDYFHQLLRGILLDTDSLDAVIVAHANRDLAQLDPVGRAVLWLSCYELAHCPSVPTRVVIDEAIELAKAYGATDSYRFVNAVLDKARKNMLARNKAEGG